MKPCGKYATFLLLLRAGYKMTGSMLKAYTLARGCLKYVRAIPFTNNVVLTSNGSLLLKLLMDGGIVMLLRMALKNMENQCSTKYTQEPM